MRFNRDDWPIAASMVQSPNRLPDGSAMQDASPERWSAVFGQYAGVGFDRVEIHDNWVRPGDMPQNRLEELRGAANAAGLSLAALAVARASIIDPDTAAENLAYSHRSIDAAAALGVSVVCFGLHRPLTPAQQSALWFWTEQGAQDPDEDASRQQAVRGFQELGDHAAELGIELSLELYEDTYLGTADSAVRLIEEIDRPNVGINPDFGNLIRLHRPVERWEELAEKTLPHTNYWHIKNYFRDEDPTRGHYATHPAPLEFGIINYRQVVSLALEIGFRGIFTCEHYGGDSLGISARNREYLRTLLPAETAADLPAAERAAGVRS